MTAVPTDICEEMASNLWELRRMYMNGLIAVERQMLSLGMLADEDRSCSTRAQRRKQQGRAFVAN